MNIRRPFRLVRLVVLALVIIGFVIHHARRFAAQPATIAAGSGDTVAAPSQIMADPNGVVTEPAQPSSGPGGSNCVYGSLTGETFGDGATSYQIFVPAQPTPDKAPVVVFLHGWSAVDPNVYGAWIAHIVRHDGAIVIYPRYQASLRTPPAEFLSNIVASVKDALARLSAGDLGVRPDESRVAFVGHSMGGLEVANLAAVAASDGLPPPRAIMAVEPGGSWGAKPTQAPVADLSAIPSGTLLITVTGDQDNLARDVDAKRIYRESTSISPSDKNYVVMQSDDHGTPRLIANHYAPASLERVITVQNRSTGPLREWLQERVNEREASGGVATAGVTALDYFGMWKLFDALTNTAFYGKDREYALGGGPLQCGMGTWSDGVPVKPLLVLHPNAQ